MPKRSRGVDGEAVAKCVLQSVIAFNLSGLEPDRIEIEFVANRNDDGVTTYSYAHVDRFNHHVYDDDDPSNDTRDVVDVYCQFATHEHVAVNTYLLKQEVPMRIRNELALLCGVDGVKLAIHVVSLDNPYCWNRVYNR